MEATLRVLVVDDERFFREAIREALEAAGCAVTTAENGMLALDLVDGGGFGVVVLDVEMPAMDGIEVLRRLRERQPETRVIILSAHAGQQFVIEALRLGAVDYLAKPLHDEELVLAVRRAHAAWRESQDLSALRRRLASFADRVRALTHEPGADLDATEDRPSIAARIVEAAADALESGKTSLLMPDAVGDALQVVAATGRKMALDEFEPVPLAGGLVGEVFVKGRGLLVEDTAADGRVAGRCTPQRYTSRSFVLAPVPGPSRVLGVLCATDRSGGAPFDASDLALLELFAQAASGWLAPPNGVASAGASVDDDQDATMPDPAVQPEAGSSGGDAGIAAGRDAGFVAGGDAGFAAGADAGFSVGADAELARRVCEAVSAEVDPARVLARTLRCLAEGLDAAPVSLHLLAPEGDELICEAQEDGATAPDRERLPSGRGLTGSVLGGAGLIATAHPDHDPRFESDVDTAADGVARPMLCLPLVFRGRCLGVVRAFLPAGRTPSARSGEVLGAAVSAALRSVLLYRSLVQSIEEVARVRRESRTTP